MLTKPKNMLDTLYLLAHWVDAELENRNLFNELKASGGIGELAKFTSREQPEDVRNNAISKSLSSNAELILKGCIDVARAVKHMEPEAAGQMLMADIMDATTASPNAGNPKIRQAVEYVTLLHGWAKGLEPRYHTPAMQGQLKELSGLLTLPNRAQIPEPPEPSPLVTVEEKTIAKKPKSKPAPAAGPIAFNPIGFAAAADAERERNEGYHEKDR